MPILDASVPPCLKEYAGTIGGEAAQCVSP
jgi:hypothetical protein